MVVSCGYVEKSELVIIGGGFAGLEILKRVSKSKWNVKLISAKDTFTSYPILPASLCGRISTNVPETPLINVVGKDVFIHGTVTNVDPKYRCVTYTEPSGKSMTISYDKLVIATGGVENTLNVPGVSEHAHFFRSSANVRAIRRRLHEQLTLAASAPAEARAHLNIVVVGGGPTGVEIAAELGDALKGEIASRYPTVSRHVSLTLVQSAPSLLKYLESDEVSTAALGALSSLGVDVKLSTRVTAETHDTVTLSTGETIPSNLTIWTAGSQPSPVATMVQDKVDALCGTTSPLGRLSVDGYLRVVNAPNNSILALGDCVTFHRRSLHEDEELSLSLTYALGRQGKYPVEAGKEVVRNALRGLVDAYATQYPQLLAWAATKRGKCKESGEMVDVSSLVPQILDEVDGCFVAPLPSAMHAQATAKYIVKQHLSKPHTVPFIPRVNNLFTPPPVVAVVYVGGGLNVMRKGEKVKIGGGVLRFFNSAKTAALVPSGSKGAFWGRKLCCGSNDLLADEAKI